MSGTDIAQLSIRVSTLEMEVAQRKMQDLGKTAGWLEGVVKKAAAAFSLWKVGGFIQEATLLAARYETLGVVMKVVGNNAGFTGAQMEAFAQGLQKTGISMVESRSALTIMAQAHIDLSKATELGRIAQDAAVIGNINSSEAFQRMIYGIQSGQVEVLRTIGINVNFEAGYQKLAATLGKTTKGLTETEKATSRMQQVLEKGPDIAGAYEASMQTAGKQLLSMKRYAEDAQVVFGALFGDAFGEGVRALNTGLQDTKKWLEANAGAAAEFRMNLGQAAARFIDILKLGSGMNTGTELWSSLMGKVAVGFAVVKDITEALWGTMMLIPSLVVSIVSGLSKVFGMDPPQWMTGWFNKNFSSMVGGFTATSTKSAWLQNKAGAPGPMAETGPLGMGLLNQELAKIKGAGAGNASTQIITESERKKAEARHKAWLQFQGENEAAERAMQRKWDWEDREERFQEMWDLNTLLIQLEEERNATLENVSQIRQAQFVADAEEMKRVNTQVFGDMGQAIVNWGQEFTNTWVDACFTGKMAFSDLVTSILRDMARMAVQKNVSDPLVSWLSKAISGRASRGTTTMTSFDVLPGYATGTDYVPQDGPAYLHKGEAVIPAAQNRAGAAPQTSIVVNVSSGGSVEAKTQGGTTLGRDLEAAVLSVIYKHQRPGGALAGA